MAVTAPSPRLRPAEIPKSNYHNAVGAVKDRGHRCFSHAQGIVGRGCPSPAPASRGSLSRGLTPNRTRWIPCWPGFFSPVGVLSTSYSAARFERSRTIVLLDIEAGLRKLSRFLIFASVSAHNHAGDLRFAIAKFQFRSKSNPIHVL